MCPEQLMDIKRNKEYLVSHRENSPHGNVLRIKTSESVGTLHSISNCTDRSFAIKESSALQTSPIPQRNGVFFQ